MAGATGLVGNTEKLGREYVCEVGVPTTLLTLLLLSPADLGMGRRGRATLSHSSWGLSGVAVWGAQLSQG